MTLALGERAALDSRGPHPQRGGFVARAALNYLWNQGENGTACPITMTFASVQVLRNAPELARSGSRSSPPTTTTRALVPVADKLGAMVGMAMTEKQGGSDLRSTQTRARRVGPTSWYELRGPQVVLLRADVGRLPHAGAARGRDHLLLRAARAARRPRNRFLIQRLKDKVGNRSNASAEIEYDGTLAQLVGEPGRGIATLIEMAHLTRFDIVVAVAGHDARGAQPGAAPLRAPRRVRPRARSSSR